MIDNMFYMSQKNWNTIQDYSRTAYDTEKSEIGGMLVAIQDEDKDWELKEPVILKQTISASNCVLDKEELALYYTKVGTKYKKKNFRFVWWHSHHTMKAFWSATDLKAIDEYKDGDFSFSLVVNLDQEYKFRISIWKPFEMHEDVELVITNTKARKIPAKIVKEVADLCSKPAYNYTTYKWGKKHTVEKYPQKQIGAGSYNDMMPVSDRQLSLGGIQDVEYNYAYRGIDGLNKKYADGSIQYPQYIADVESLNSDLNTIYDGKYQIEILAKEVLESTIMFNSPAEYIAMNVDAYEEEEELKSWNASFGVRGYY